MLWYRHRIKNSLFYTHLLNFRKKTKWNPDTSEVLWNHFLPKVGHIAAFKLVLIIDNPSASWLAKVFHISWPLNHSLCWRQVWILIYGSWTLRTCSFRDLRCACTCSANMQSFSKIQRFYFLRAWAEMFSSGIFTLTLSNRFNYFDIVSIDYFPNNFCFLRNDWQSRQTFLWNQVFLLNPILPLSF